MLGALTSGRCEQGPLLVRLVAIDYYMTPPTAGLDVCFSYFEGTTVDLVPVVRIFGSTPAGQKACVHLHKASFYLNYSLAE